MEGILKPFGELTLYQGYGQKIMDGLKPYVDFKPDYPPFALVLFNMANIFGSQWFTLMWYGMISLATIGMMILIKKLKGNPYIYLACVLPLGGLYWDRFDVFAALFSLWAIYLAKKKNYWSFYILVIGIMIKIYPIILLPIILAMFWMESFKKAVIGLILFLFLLTIAICPQKEFLAGMYEYHGHRGIQIESIKAMPLLFKEDSIVEWKHGTYEIREEIK